MTAHPPLPVLVLGTGKIGRLVCQLLATSGDYAVTAVDLHAAQAEAAVRDAEGRTYPHARGVGADFTDPAVLVALGQGQRYIVSCAPYRCNLTIAEAARVVGAHYLDLTEDVNTTKGVMKLADGAPTAFIPQCGLAPGFISIVAAHLAEGMEPLERVHLRVGALPLHPRNHLKYNLTWSTDGLINEYCNPCEAVIDGQLQLVPALEGLETITIDGEAYEAFNTSGGLGTLADTWMGKVRRADYKTLRYPGHRDLIAFLLEDLGFKQDREALKALLDRNVPHTTEDQVLIYVSAVGYLGGILSERTYAHKMRFREIGGRVWGAIQVSTASGICAVLDLHAAGAIQPTGLVRQETVPYAAFIANRFGKAYA